MLQRVDEDSEFSTHTGTVAVTAAFAPTSSTPKVRGGSKLEVGSRVQSSAATTSQRPP